MKNRSEKIKDELAALARMRDEDIDTSDIPETLDWTGAVVGKFYRPAKEALSLRLDVDILAWLKRQGPGYQTRINELLRTAMTAGASAGAGRRKEAPCRRTGSEPAEAMCRTFRYPSLERHGELQKSDEIARVIADKRSFFATAR